MARYFFHVSGEGNTFDDQAGTVLSRPDAAARQAAVIASELGQGGETYRGYLVFAVDENGREITKLTVGATPA
jgi:hypothetical protein